MARSQFLPHPVLLLLAENKIIMKIFTRNGVTPYTRDILKKDFPNTSFPKNVFGNESLRSEYGISEVPASELPPSNVQRITQEIRNGFRAVEGTPEFVDSAWRQTWEYVALTFEEVIGQLRYRRNSDLEATDWHALEDVTMTDSIKTYRQSLRDLPAGLTTAEQVRTVSWPVHP